jgi:hypothetical protein
MDLLSTIFLVSAETYVETWVKVPLLIFYLMVHLPCDSILGVVLICFNHVLRLLNIYQFHWSQ